MKNHFKETAALVGEPIRATILWTLLDGKAFTASELAIAANTSASNISMHLAKLVNADLLKVENHDAIVTIHSHEKKLLMRLKH